VFSSQVLVYAYISRVFPPANRATALGWSAGVGRLGAITGPVLGGALLTAGIAYPWGFYVFALIGVVGGLAVFTARRPDPVEPEHPDGRTGPGARDRASAGEPRARGDGPCCLAAANALFRPRKTQP